MFLRQHGSIFSSFIKSKRNNSTAPKLTDLGFLEYFREIFNTSVDNTQFCLEYLHYCHLPWWCSIIAGTGILRLIVFPARVYVQRQQSILQKVNEDMQIRHIPLIREEIKRGVVTGKLKANSANAIFKITAGKTWLQSLRERDTHPFRTLIPLLIQLPLFFSMTSALRKMSAFPWPFSGELIREIMIDGWSQGGILWFPNLGTPNIWLTGLVMVSNIVTIEILFRLSKNGTTKRRFLYWLMHGLSVSSGFILSMLPSVRSFSFV